MLTLASEHPLANIGVVDTAIVALLGYGIVFVGLIALMVVVIILGKAFTAAEKRKAAQTVVEAPAPAPAPAPEPVKAPGSAGSLKLHDVEPKTAAMIMAIVADKLGKPLNELRFTSIKEVK